jgi:iron complex outermembrane receptor protein
MGSCSIEGFVKKALKRVGVSAVAFKENGELVLTFEGSGVRPVFEFIDKNNSQLDKYAGLYWGDRVVGKASAMLLILTKPKYIYGELMSEEAMKVLEAHGITFGFGEKVPYIMNIKQDGMCPFEKAVIDIEEPSNSPQKIKGVFESFKKK